MAYKNKDKERKAKLRHYYNNKQQYIDRNKKTHEKLVLFLNNYKKNLHCLICKENESCCLDFHHLNPEQKITEIARLMKGGSLRKLKEELLKCIPLCANCHRKLHAGLININTGKLSEATGLQNLV